MRKRPTKYCDVCESLVYADDVHSCYNAALAVAIKDAERKVVEAAEAWSEDHDDEKGTVNALWRAVRELRVIREVPREK